jgi:protein gp37
VAESTNIAWATSTFNPWIGCTKVSPGCEHCYASVSTPARALGVTWGGGQERRRTSESNWMKPLAWDRKARETGQPWRVFCGSLCDVFDNEVSRAWRRDLFTLIDATPYLTWMLLTKRIGNAAGMLHENMAAPYPWPNVWLGATVVNQDEADRDIPKLLAVPAAVRFLSIEPMLGPINLRNLHIGSDTAIHREWGVPSKHDHLDCLHGALRSRVDWVIVGGESDQPGMKARTLRLEWARDIARQCKGAGVPCFVKQLGSRPVEYVDGDYPNVVLGYLKDRAGADPAEWPEDLLVREFP